MMTNILHSRQWVFLEGKIFPSPSLKVVVSFRQARILLCDVIIQTVSLPSIVKEWNSISIRQKKGDGQWHADVPGRVNVTVQTDECTVLLNGKENDARKGEHWCGYEVASVQNGRQLTFTVVLVTLCTEERRVYQRAISQFAVIRQELA